MGICYNVTRCTAVVQGAPRSPGPGASSHLQLPATNRGSGVQSLLGCLMQPQGFSQGPALNGTPEMLALLSDSVTQSTYMRLSAMTQHQRSRITHVLPCMPRQGKGTLMTRGTNAALLCCFSQYCPGHTVNSHLPDCWCYLSFPA
jgi:hypothetical protein